MQNQEVPLRCEWYSVVSTQIREYMLTVPLSQEKEEEPVVKIMVDDAIVIRENYFSLPVKKTDTSKAPLHFPVPVVRYLVKEVSLVWHLYGGKDFGTAPPTSPAKSYM